MENLTIQQALQAAIQALNAVPNSRVDVCIDGHAFKTSYQLIPALQEALGDSGKFDTQALKKTAKENGWLASLWGADDVLEVHPGLTHDQCMEVLEKVEHYHDAEIGINWDVIRYHAEYLFGELTEAEEEKTFPTS